MIRLLIRYHLACQGIIFTRLPNLGQAGISVLIVQFQTRILGCSTIGPTGNDEGRAPLTDGGCHNVLSVETKMIDDGFFGSHEVCARRREVQCNALFFVLLMF